MTLQGVLTTLGAARWVHMLRGMSAAFVWRGVITLSNLALVTLAARTLGAHEFGTYSILFSAAGLCSVIATCGQQIFLMRAWSEYTSEGRPDRLKGALVFGFGANILCGVLIGAPFSAWYAAGHDATLTLAVTAYFALVSITLTTTHLVRAAIGVTVADGYSALLVIGPGILYLLGCAILGASVVVADVFIAMAAGAAATLALHIALVRRQIRKRFPHFAEARARIEWRDWTARSVKLWMSNALDSANQYADVVIIGFLMTPSVAGGYFITTRIANAFAMATGAMYMYSTKHLPNLYYRRQFAELDKMLDGVAVVTLAIIVCGMIAILGGGTLILRAFSADYVGYYGALALLSFGTAAVAAAGASPAILMLTGHEGRYLAITGSAVLLRALGFFALTPWFGVIGAVSATTLSFFWMAAMLRSSARHLAGIDGSVLRLIDRLGARRASLRAE